MRIRGLPQDRADYAAGQICAVLGNIHREKGAPPFKASDFVPTPIDAESQTELELPGEDVIDLNQVSADLQRMLGKKDADHGTSR